MANLENPGKCLDLYRKPVMLRNPNLVWVIGIHIFWSLSILVTSFFIPANDHCGFIIIIIYVERKKGVLLLLNGKISEITISKKCNFSHKLYIKKQHNAKQ